jgi:hypothetical protein
MVSSERSYSTLVYVAFPLTLLWAALWVWLGVADSVAGGAGILGFTLHVSIPGLIFLFAIFIPLRWEKFGGEMLLAVGIIIALLSAAQGDRDPMIKLVRTLVLCLPPIVGGLLFLVDARAHRTLN